MYIAMVYVCESRFSHTPLRLAGTYIEGEFSRSAVLGAVADHKARFEARRYSALKVVVTDIRAEVNEVEIIENLDLKNPLAKKTVINPTKKDPSVVPKKVVMSSFMTVPGPQFLGDGMVPNPTTETF